MKTDYSGLLKHLNDAGVEFIVVGGVAGIAHGSARFTQDVDIVYRRSTENIRRIVATFSDKPPYPRGAPLGLPFIWDEQTIQMGLNFTLTTSLGNIDLLGEITGGGTYEQLLPFSSPMSVYGVACDCLDLDKLIEVKIAAGRPKDFEAIAELQALNEESQNGE
jgi:predicted nucleotidyltransferase